MCQFHTEFASLCLVCIISPSCTWTCGGAGVSSLKLTLSPCCVLWHGSMPVCVCLCVRLCKKRKEGDGLLLNIVSKTFYSEWGKNWHRHHSYTECIILCTLEIQKESCKNIYVHRLHFQTKNFSNVNNHKLVFFWIGIYAY